MILQSLHSGDLVTAHGRLYRVLLVRGDWATCRGVRHEVVQWNVRELELAGALP
jgi:uncharacterized protein (UPF0179 family)